jgi:hypothetical protein
VFPFHDERGEGYLSTCEVSIAVIYRVSINGVDVFEGLAADGKQRELVQLHKLRDKVLDFPLQQEYGVSLL